jgi:aminoglycoside 6'-N-acetyltransferase
MVLDRVLRGDGLLVRTAEDADADAVLAILREPSVARWWGPAERADVLELVPEAAVIEVDGTIAGWMLVDEETDPMYRRVGLDISLSAATQGRGVGPAALRLVIREYAARGHHRFTIDPRASNERAIRAYASLGFKPVGTMRAYERDLHTGEWNDGLLMDLLIDELT